MDPPGVLVRLVEGVVASASRISSGVMGCVMCLPSYLNFLRGACSASWTESPFSSAANSGGCVLYLYERHKTVRLKAISDEISSYRVSFRFVASQNNIGIVLNLI